MFKKITLSVLMLLMASFGVAQTIDLYKSPTCGCCQQWADIMKEEGYEIIVHHEKDLAAIKDQYQVPEHLRSCHTAIIDGKVFEGHIPAIDIKSFIKSNNDSIGLAVGGMPMMSPGMAPKGAPYSGFDVVEFKEGGKMRAFNTYPNPQ